MALGRLDGANSWVAKVSQLPIAVPPSAGRAATPAFAAAAVLGVHRGHRLTPPGIGVHEVRHIGPGDDREPGAVDELVDRRGGAASGRRDLRARGRHRPEVSTMIDLGGRARLARRTGTGTASPRRWRAHRWRRRGGTRSRRLRRSSRPSGCSCSGGHRRVDALSLATLAIVGRSRTSPPWSCPLRIDESHRERSGRIATTGVRAITEVGPASSSSRARRCTPGPTRACRRWHRGASPARDADSRRRANG